MRIDLVSHLSQISNFGERFALWCADFFVVFYQVTCQGDEVVDSVLTKTKKRTLNPRWLYIIIYLNGRIPVSHMYPYNFVGTRPVLWIRIRSVRHQFGGCETILFSRKFIILSTTKNIDNFRIWISIIMESPIRICINTMRRSPTLTIPTIHSMIQVGRGVSVPGETSGAQTSSRGQILYWNISSSI